LEGYGAWERFREQRDPRMQPIEPFSKPHISFVIGDPDSGKTSLCESAIATHLQAANHIPIWTWDGGDLESLFPCIPRQTCPICDNPLRHRKSDLPGGIDTQIHLCPSCTIKGNPRNWATYPVMVIHPPETEIQNRNPMIELVGLDEATNDVRGVLRRANNKGAFLVLSQFLFSEPGEVLDLIGYWMKEIPNINVHEGFKVAWMIDEVAEVIYSQMKTYQSESNYRAKILSGIRQARHHNIWMYLATQRYTELHKTARGLAQKVLVKLSNFGNFPPELWGVNASIWDKRQELIRRRPWNRIPSREQIVINRKYPMFDHLKARQFYCIWKQGRYYKLFQANPPSWSHKTVQDTGLVLDILKLKIKKHSSVARNIGGKKSKRDIAPMMQRLREDGKTMKEIAVITGYSESQVSNLLSRYRIEKKLAVNTQ